MEQEDNDLVYCKSQNIKVGKQLPNIVKFESSSKPVVVKFESSPMPAMPVVYKRNLSYLSDELQDGTLQDEFEDRTVLDEFYENSKLD